MKEDRHIDFHATHWLIPPVPGAEMKPAALALQDDALSS